MTYGDLFRIDDIPDIGLSLKRTKVRMFLFSRAAWPQEKAGVFYRLKTVRFAEPFQKS